MSHCRAASRVQPSREWECYCVFNINFPDFTRSMMRPLPPSPPLASLCQWTCLVSLICPPGGEVLVVTSNPILDPLSLSVVEQVARVRDRQPNSTLSLRFRASQIQPVDPEILGGVSNPYRDPCKHDRPPRGHPRNPGHHRLGFLLKQAVNTIQGYIFEIFSKKIKHNRKLILFMVKK